MAALASPIACPALAAVVGRLAPAAAALAVSTNLVRVSRRSADG